MSANSEALLKLAGDYESDVSGVSGEIDDTDPAEVIAAPGAGKRILITDILVTNADTAAGAVVQILSDDNVLWEGYAHAEGGGFNTNFAKPLVANANEAINAKCLTAPESGGVYVSVNGHIQKVR